MRSLIARHPIFIAVIVLFFGLQVTFTATWIYSIARERLTAAAGIRDTIFYQGKIASSTNIPPASGNYNMKFLVYSAQTSGSVLWTEVWDSTSQGISGSKVNINNGVFSVELNSLCGDWQGSCASNGGVNFNDDSLWLEVQFDPDGDSVYQEVFTPRKRLTAIPYALNADKVDGKSIGTSGNSIPVLDASNTWSAPQTVQNTIGGTVPFIIMGASGQSAALQQWKSDSGAVVASISSNGTLTVSSFGTSQITSPVTGSTGVAPSVAGSTIGYWKFDEASGTTASDSSGNGLTATFDTAPTWESGYFGYTGDRTATLAGSQTATVADAANLDGGSALSVEFWVKTADAGTGGIVNKFNAGNVPTTDDAYQLKIAAGQVQVILSSGGTNATVASSSINVNDNAWHHVVYTFAKPTSALYIDGVYDSAAAYTAFDYVITDSTDPLIIGALKTSDVLGSYFTGSLDALSVYNAALSAGTIATHFSEGSGSVVAQALDTSGTLSGAGAKLLSVRNNGTEKASIGADGTISAGPALLTLTTDTQGLVITSSATQTADLIELKDSTGAVLTSFTSTGALSASGLRTSAVTSNAAETIGAPAVNNATQRAYWKFNDGFPATTVADETTGAHVGSITAATWLTPGYFGTESDDALTFDGSSAVVTVPNDTNLNPGTGSFTVEAWVRPSSYNTDGAGWVESVLTKADGDFSNGYSLEADGATQQLPIFRVSDGSSNTALAAGTARLALDTWHHLVGTWDATAKTATLYVDGASVGTDTDATVGTIAPSADLTIGRYYRGSQARYEYFTGDIDNPIIWGAALTGTQVATHYQMGAGLSAAVTIDTASAYSGENSRLLSIKNNGVEKAAITSSGGFTSTGQMLLNLGSDTTGLLIYGYTGQTADLQRWYDPSRSLYTSVNSMGLINAPAVFAKNIIANGSTVTESPAVTTAMSAYWNLDESSGTSVADIAGTNTATATDVAWGTGQFAYTGDHSAQFNGTSSYIDTPVAISGSAAQFAFELWVNPSSVTADQDIIAQTDATGTNQLFRLNIHGITPNKLSFRVTDAAAAHSVITAPLSPASWHHIYGAWTGTAQELYVDGVLAGSVPLSTIFATQTSHIIIGKQGEASAGYFTGSIDTVIVYSAPLTAGEIYSHYSTGRAATGLAITGGTTLTGQSTLLSVANLGAQVASISTSGTLRLTLSDDYPGLVIRASGTQTADLTQWQNAAGTAIAGVSPAGAGYFTGLETRGKFVGKRTAVTVPSYTAQPNDYLIEVNYASGTVDITLPTAVGITGQMYVIKDASGTAAANTITLHAAGGELIDAGGTATIAANYGSLTVYSNGTGWLILN